MRILAHAVALACFGLACAGSEEPPRVADEEPIPVELVSPDVAEEAELRARLDAVSGLDADTLLASRAVPHASALDYTPSDAANMSLVQASSFSLDAAQLRTFDERGFVITDDVFPSFAYGYETIYMQDLPVYVSADSVLEAVHRSYEDILLSLELTLLIPSLHELLTRMREQLAIATHLEAGMRADADLFLAVAMSLVDDDDEGVAPPVAGASADEIAGLVTRATAAVGMETRTLFGRPRTFDFSQFTPRGHYADDVSLQRYFRAMMWLQRVDFRLIEIDALGRPTFLRRQLEAAVALRQLMDDEALTHWQNIDRAATAFVGERDSMLPVDLDAFLSSVGSDLDARSDRELAQAIIDGGWGSQRISSHIMINGLGQGTLPLNRSLTFFGPRYTADAHVLSNVVFDRAQGGTVRRMLPDPLDVAYAAFGNDSALPPLAEGLHMHPYAPDLEAMRLLVDEHEPAYWESSLYTLWTNALRGLSTHAAEGFPDGLPTVAHTEPWQRRLISAQLASWAELRHDTVLYAKESYSGGAACEFPDAYVDPYPAFWRGLERYGAQGLTLVDSLAWSQPDVATRARTHFDAVQSVGRTLAEMAEAELAGTRFTDEQMAFINQAVRLEVAGCVSERATGWYGLLHFDATSAAEREPVVADVHTAPTDAGGTPVGWVLHAGTGLPRAMVVSVDSCTGPRTYVGLASTYHEEVTEQYQRLTDEEWASELDRPHPAWTRDLFVPLER